jgi:hypothetical protein
MTTFSITDPTAARTITFPDADGTVMLTGSAAGGDLTGQYPDPTIASGAGNNIVAAINNASTTTDIDVAKLAEGTDGDMLYTTGSVPVWTSLNSLAWGLTGNRGTTSGTNFVGTTDNTALELRVDDNSSTYYNSFYLGTNNEVWRDGSGSTVPGNARGLHAVDMQSSRTNSTEIATGDYSTISGGRNNTATSNNSTIGGGANNVANNSSSGNEGNQTIAGGIYNTASADHTTIGGGLYNTSSHDAATVSGGSNNTASGAASTVGGGYQNQAGGEKATIAGGDNNQATGDFSTVPGGIYASADKYGQMAYASGQFSNTGDAQTSLFVVRNQTTDNSTPYLYLNGSSQSMTLPANTTWLFKAYVVGRNADGSANSAGYKIEGLIDDSGLITSTTTTISAPLGWTAPSAVLNSGALCIRVAGIAGLTIRWVARVEVIEVNL